MIHGRTAETKKRETRRVIAVIVAVVLAVVLWFTWDSANVEAEAQSALSVRNAVMDAALQCAAVEGAYPSSLDHLVEAYGIRFDPEVYDVRYEVFADNVAPTVQVMRR